MDVTIFDIIYSSAAIGLASAMIIYSILVCRHITRVRKLRAEVRTAIAMCRDHNT